MILLLTCQCKYYLSVSLSACLSVCLSSCLCQYVHAYPSLPLLACQLCLTVMMLCWFYYVSCSVACHSNYNLMQASNLGVVFGPTLIRPEVETVARINNIKYQNIIVEMMIDEKDKVLLCICLCVCVSVRIHACL